MMAPAMIAPSCAETSHVTVRVAAATSRGSEIDLEFSQPRNRVTARHIWDALDEQGVASEDVASLMVDGHAMRREDGLPEEGKAVDLMWTLDGGGKGGMAFEAVQPAANGFCWLKLCCVGDGMDCGPIESIYSPYIEYSKCCCIVRQCGCSGFPDIMKEDWCQEKCCCFKTYCGISAICEAPFQLCCIKVGPNFKPPFAVVQPALNGFCWFKCCCSGNGMDCDPVNSLWQPIEMGKCCCINSACGLTDCKCDIMKDNWCESKCCCFKHYCGIGPICGDCFQLCCLKFTLGGGGGGSSSVGSGGVQIAGNMGNMH